MPIAMEGGIGYPVRSHINDVGIVDRIPIYFIQELVLESGNMGKRRKVGAAGTVGKNMEKETALSTEMGGFTSEEKHKQGIIPLLNQLFRDSSFNVSSITNFIIENGIGTVVIEVPKDEGSEEDEEDEEDKEDEEDEEDKEDEDEGENEVFAISASINLKTNPQPPGVKELTEFLLQKIKDNGSKEIDDFVKKLFVDDGISTCNFVVNERFVNLPARAALSLLHCMKSEEFDGSNSPNDFIICILKLYKRESKTKLCYVNSEEKIIVKFAAKYIDYPVSVEEFGYVYLSRRKKPEDCPQFRRICFISKKIFYTKCFKRMTMKIADITFKFLENLNS